MISGPDAECVKEAREQMELVEAWFPVNQQQVRKEEKQHRTRRYEGCRTGAAESDSAFRSRVVSARCRGPKPTAAVAVTIFPGVLQILRLARPTSEVGHL